jgi:hypothetical protein
MEDATGEAKEPRLRVAFDRQIKLEFHGARITSDGVNCFTPGDRQAPISLHCIEPSHMGNLG